MEAKTACVIHKEINMFGFYQKRYCLLLFLACIPNAFTTFQFLVIHYKPPFRCDVGEIKVSIFYLSFSQANIMS